MTSTEPQLLLSYQPAAASLTLVSPYGGEESHRRNVVYPMTMACLIGLSSRELSESQTKALTDTLATLAQY